MSLQDAFISMNLIEDCLVKASVYSNTQKPISELINAELRAAVSFKVASAFLNSAGLKRLRRRILELLDRRGSLELIHGADFHIADPAAIRDLANWNLEYPKMEYRVLPKIDLLKSQAFHPKLYIMSSESKSTAVVGSSNLTGAGLATNREINAVLRGDHRDNALQQCSEAFEELRNIPELVQPDGRFVNLYEEMYVNVKSRKLPVGEVPDDLAEKLKEICTKNKQIPNWNPRSQFDVVVMALQNLSQDAADEFLHLSDIYRESERVARSYGLHYQWTSWKTSVRGRINSHILNEESPKPLFSRSPTGQGLYRLTNFGRNYTGGDQP